MHRNTFLTMSGLAVIAALLLGLNIGMKIPDFNKAPTTAEIETSPSPIAQATPSPSPLAQAPVQGKILGANVELQTYQNSTCGYGFSFPKTWSYSELEAETVIFTDPEKKEENVTVICQADIPRPNIETKYIESTTLGDAKAELYHDSDPETGKQLDAILTSVPGVNTKKDIIVSGYGSVFNHVHATFRFFKPSPLPTTAPTAQPVQPTAAPVQE